MKKLVSLLLVLCMLATMGLTTALAAAADGAFEVTVDGRNGEMTVEVTFADGKLADVVVTKHEETPGISDAAINQLPADIVKNQSIAVDVIAGATITSEAVLAGVKAAIEAAGGDVADFSAAQEKTAGGEKITKTADVLVVGGGGAGLSAAIEATNKGASVILIEKQAFLGGNTAICGGLVPCPGTDMQKAAGIEDSPEKYAEDVMIANGYTGDPELVKVATEEAADLVPWFESLGTSFLKTVPFAGNSVERLHQEIGLSGAGLVEVMKNAAEANGVDIMLQTTGEHLIQDVSGAIIGVKATTADGTEVELFGKSVILATGGFAANKEMLAEYIPEMIGSGLLGNPGNTGDAIKMGLEVGADLNYVDAYLSHAAVNPEKVLLITWEAMMRGGILVNENGERFIDEALGYAKCAPAVAGQNRVYVVIDENIRAEVEKMAGYDSVTTVAANAAELAAAIDINADGLAATIESYNKAVAEGNDAFGRTVFVKPLEGTLYAINVETYLLFTTGGLRIDASARVLDAEGNIIPGLYAAGEAAGTSVAGHGYAGYITGEGLLSALPFGRIAGRHAGEAAVAK